VKVSFPAKGFRFLLRIYFPPLNQIPNEYYPEVL